MERHANLESAGAACGESCRNKSSLSHKAQRQIITPTLPTPHGCCPSPSCRQVFWLLAHCTETTMEQHQMFDPSLQLKDQQPLDALGLTAHAHTQIPTMPHLLHTPHKSCPRPALQMMTTPAVALNTTSTTPSLLVHCGVTRPLQGCTRNTTHMATHITSKTALATMQATPVALPSKALSTRWPWAPPTRPGITLQVAWNTSQQHHPHCAQYTFAMGWSGSTLPRVKMRPTA